MYIMSYSVTLSQDLNSAVAGINLKWVYAGLSTIKELSLVYFKNTDDADIVSLDIASGLMKLNLPSGFDSGQSYSFQLQALDISGHMAFSSPFSVVAPWFLVAPEIISVSGGDQSLMVHLAATSNTLSSSDTSVEFVLKRADNFVFWIIKPYASSGNYTLSFDDSGALLNNTSYRIACMFQPEDSNSRYTAPSALSQSMSATPSNIPNIPQSISASTVGVTDYSIKVNWTRPNDFNQWSAGGFSIILQTTNSLNESSSITLTSDVITYTLTGMAAGLSYVFYVSYVNQYGTGPQATTYGYTYDFLLPTRIADAPVFISAVAGDMRAVLSWSAPVSNGQTDITSYKVYQDGAYIGSVGATGPVPPIFTYQASIGLLNGYQYAFTVSAVNAIGESVQCAPLSATPYADMYIVSVVASGKTLTATIKPNGNPIQSVVKVALDADPNDAVDDSFVVSIPQEQISQVQTQNITVVKTFSGFSSDITKWVCIAHNAQNSAFLQSM